MLTPSHIIEADYPFHYDRRKAREVILYIANRTLKSDRFHICKIVYFADRYHLEHYAGLIYGDNYTAMEYGPVPSGLYDIIKQADLSGDKDIVVTDSGVTALRDADLDELSESDKEALNWAIERYGNMPFKELSKISHDEVWNAATNNGKEITPNSPTRAVPIPFQRIIESTKNGDLIWSYLQEFC
ncbi:MAG TPA: Panacea domain-containing protein [Blastocatellia bacterium]|nr:Panacea domain-containing protein [Blastocatellia bacterium]